MVLAAGSKLYTCCTWPQSKSMVKPYVLRVRASSCFKCGLGSDGGRTVIGKCYYVILFSPEMHSFLVTRTEGLKEENKVQELKVKINWLFSKNRKVKQPLLQQILSTRKSS